MAGCSSTANKRQEAAAVRTKNYTAPPAGATIAADSMKLPDELNEQYFAVQIKSTEYSSNGAYKVLAHYGFNAAEGSFTFPKGGRDIMPVLQKSEKPFTYVIGFYWGDDPTFNGYYEVSAQRGQIKMKYIKAYSFQ